MRSAVLFAAAAGLALSGCNRSHAEDAGTDVSRAFQVGGFDKIEIAGPYDVEVTTGAQPSVRARGPGKIIERMVVEVDGDTLKLHPRKNGGMFGGWDWTGSRGKARIAVSVPALHGALIAGQGDLGVDRLASDRFEGTIAGSGNLTLRQVELTSLNLEIAGSGNATGNGRAKSASYTVAGSGNIRAAGIASEQAEVDIAGSGNVEANVRSTANVSIAGVGNVRITGGAKCSVDKAGVGNVECS